MGTRSLSSRPGRIVTGLPVRKYEQAAAIVRAQITDGTLKPGQPPPRRGRAGPPTLIHAHLPQGPAHPDHGRHPHTGAEPGRPSPRRRPRRAAPRGRGPPAVPRAGRGAPRQRPDSARPVRPDRLLGHHDRARRDRRLWQSRQFWEKADLALAARGELTSLYDACRAETASPAIPGQPGTPFPGLRPSQPPSAASPSTGPTGPSPPPTRPPPACPADREGTRLPRAHASAARLRRRPTARNGARFPRRVAAPVAGAGGRYPPGTPSGRDSRPLSPAGGTRNYRDGQAYILVAAARAARMIAAFAGVPFSFSNSP